MAKTAYLLTFHATTRIVVDSENNPFEDYELFSKCVDTARKRILDFGIEEYLCFENAEMKRDAEVPYNEYDDGAEEYFVKD